MLLYKKIENSEEMIMNSVSPVVDRPMDRRDFLRTLGAGAAAAGAAQFGFGTDAKADDKPSPFAAVNSTRGNDTNSEFGRALASKRTPEIIPRPERTELSKTLEGLIEYGQRRLVLKTQEDFASSQDFKTYMSNIESRYKVLGHDGFNTYVANLDRLRNHEPHILNDTDVDLYNRTTDMLLPPKFLAKLQTEVERGVDVNNINQRADAYMTHMKQRPFVQVSSASYGTNSLTATTVQNSLSRK